MYIIVLTIYLQYGLTVEKTTIEQPNTRYSTEASCLKRKAAMNLASQPLPKPPGYAAKWQEAKCKKL